MNSTINGNAAKGYGGGVENGIWDLADWGTGNMWLVNEYETASWE